MFLRHKKFLGLSLLFILIISASFIFIKFVNADELPADADVSGYAWSSNIGWISFEAPQYKVVLKSNSNLEGYAWSSNIGWIKMNPEIDSTLPISAFGRDISAKLSNGKIIGWARAISVLGSCPTEPGPMKCNSDRGGWDGWISFDSENVTGSPTYGVTYLNGKFSGYAWGSTVLGWISFCDETNGYCVKTNDFKIRCDADTNSDGGFGERPPADDDSQVLMSGTPATANVAWQATVITGGTGPFTYTWSGDATGVDSNQALRTSQTSAIYNLVGPKNVGIHIEDSNIPKKTADGSCSVDVKNPTAKTLTVYIVSSNGATGSVNIPGWSPSICTATPDNSVDCGTVDYGITDTNIDLLVNPGDYNNAGVPTPYSVSWSGDVPGNCTTNCPITVDGPKTVFVNLFKPGVQYLSKITAIPPVITINSHNSGQSAFSNSSIIHVEALAGVLGGKVCLKSIVSELGSHPELGSVVPRSPKCYLGSGVGAKVFVCNAVSGLNDTNCINVSPGDSLDIPFRIEVLDRLVAVFDNSPYRAVIGVREVVDTDPNNADSSDSNVNVRFFYRVGDIRP